MVKRVEIGSVPVDGGVVMVIDPSYLRDNGNGQPISFAMNEQTIEEIIEKCCYPGPGHGQIGMGVASTTQVGDGVFPAYAVYDKSGRLLRIEVVFTKSAPWPVEA